MPVCSRIENAKPINSTDLITLVLLAANGRGLDADQISRQAGEIVELIEQRELPTAGDLRRAMNADLQSRLDSLTATGLLEGYEKGAAPVYSITPGRQLAAAYYRNTIVHYFLSSAIAEIALVAAGPGASKEAIIDVAMKLRDLLKFEFFFKVKAEFRNALAGFLDTRYPRWGESASDIRATPLFGTGILRSFVEAYRILALLLVSRGSQDIGVEDEDALIGGCLDRGEEMLRRKEISTEAALAQPLFETALRLAKYRRLLQGESEELIERRKAFAAELEDVLDAINQMQESYDAALGYPATGGLYEQRSIA